MFTLKCIVCLCERHFKSERNFNLTIKRNRLHCRACALKIAYSDPELRSKLSKISKEKLSPNEMRKKISDRTKNKLNWADVRVKISDANKKRFQNQSQRKIQQENGIKRWSDSDARKEHSDILKRAWLDPIIRKKYTESNKNSTWCKVKCDKNQPHLIDKWNRLGFNFKINFQIVCDSNIYYLDGYDEEKNVILEIDSKYHKKPTQKEKDLIRQNNIIAALNPNCFWRYNDADKKYNNVYRKI